MLLLTTGILFVILLVDCKVTHLLTYLPLLTLFIRIHRFQNVEPPFRSSSKLFTYVAYTVRCFSSLRKPGAIFSSAVCDLPSFLHVRISLTFHFHIRTHRRYYFHFLPYVSHLSLPTHTSAYNLMYGFFWLFPENGHIPLMYNTVIFTELWNMIFLVSFLKLRPHNVAQCHVAAFSLWLGCKRSN